MRNRFQYDAYHDIRLNVNFFTTHLTVTSSIYPLTMKLLSIGFFDKIGIVVQMFKVYFGGNAVDDNLRPCAGPGGAPANNPVINRTKMIRP